MAKTAREQRHDAIKRALADANGSVMSAAAMLNMTPKHLSAVLNAGLRAWWTRYKDKRSREKDRARHRRWYANRQRRELAAAGLDPDKYESHKKLFVDQ